MPSISARIPENEREQLDEVADLLGEERSTTIRRALAHRLRPLLLHATTESSAH